MPKLSFDITQMPTEDIQFIIDECNKELESRNVCCEKCLLFDEPNDQNCMECIGMKNFSPKE